MLGYNIIKKNLGENISKEEKTMCQILAQY